jgi:pyruvate formate lyase activating enzyme
VIKRSAIFAPALRSMGGGLTISGGEVMVQMAFTRRILAAAKQMGLHTAIETSGFLGDRVDERYLSVLDLVLLDIKSGDPDTYKRATGRDLAPTLRFAERLAKIGKPCGCASRWCRGLTDDPGQRRQDREVRRADEERRVGGGAAVPPARRLQMEGDGDRLQGSEYAVAPPELVKRVREQFRAAGCRAR